jgi:hypothetical protein
MKMPFEIGIQQKNSKCTITYQDNALRIYPSSACNLSARRRHTKTHI